MIYYLLFIVFLYINKIISIKIGEDIYCREKNRLITSEDSDEYLLTSVEINTMVKLLCRYCNDKEEIQPKIWYYQDRLQTLPEKEVELGMDNNISYNRIYVMLDLSLMIKNIVKTDAGIYRCHGQEGQEEEYKFNYRIEQNPNFASLPLITIPVISTDVIFSVVLVLNNNIENDILAILKDQSDTFLETGNITNWEEYRVINLLSVTTRFAVSKMLDLVYLRQEGIILEVISEWGPWNSCEKCIHNLGIRTRKGYCRLKRRFDKNVILDHTSEVVRFFNKTPTLPCKSILLQEEFPIVSNAIKYLPEFILEEACKNCTKVKKKSKRKKFKYRKHYVFLEGSHFAISCPESDLQSKIIWKKNSIVLKQGVKRSFRKTEVEARMMVDTFSTLYIIDITKEEEGNYTCYVDNVNMMQMKIVVVTKSKFWTLALVRHMGYLGFILLLTSFCYCTGLIITCRRKDTFKISSIENNEAYKKGEYYLKEKNEEESLLTISNVDDRE